MKNPKEIIQTMIDSRGYLGVNISKDENEMFTVKSNNNIPIMIYSFIYENYTVNYSTKKYIEFYQFE